MVTQFYFGYRSLFSGQKLYETFFYLQFNLTMTSLPIMIYAVFDFEYYKNREAELQQSGKVAGNSKYLMATPSLYKIGLNRECVSRNLFLLWVFYGLL